MTFTHVRFFQFIPKSDMYLLACVRWGSNGEMLANAGDQTAKLLDFKTGKLLYGGLTSDERNKYEFLHMSTYLNQNH